MLEKRIITETINEEIVNKEIFVESIVETKEIIWTKDSIESQITQKQNTIDNLLLEIQQLEWKLAEINALENK